MKYLHRLARLILPYGMLCWWYRKTVKNFIGTYYRIPIVTSNYLIGEDLCNK